MSGIKLQTNVPQNSRVNAVKILRRNEQKRARCGAQDGVLMPHIGSIFYIAGERWIYGFFSVRILKASIPRSHTRT